MQLSKSKKQWSRLRPIIGAIAFACFLWLYVALNGTYIDDIECKVNLVNLRSGKTLAAPLPEFITINITCRGIDFLWLHLFSKSDLTFNLDLQTISRYFELPVKEYSDWINLPSGLGDVITFNSIVQPEIIKIEIDDLDSVLLPVSDDNLLITVKEGYTQVGKALFQPDSVLVTGPKRKISQMDKILTDPKISFENKSKDFTKTIGLDKPHESIVSYSDIEVKVSADIQKIDERIINTPIRVLQKPPGYSVEVKPSTLKITFLGGVDYIEDITADDFIASVIFDRSWEKGEDYVVFVDVKVPEYIIEYQISPMEFTVEVR